MKQRQDFAREHGPDADYTCVARAIDLLNLIRACTVFMMVGGENDLTTTQQVKSVENAAGEEIRARGRQPDLLDQGSSTESNR